MPGEERKNQGGDELNQTQINEIAAAVKRSLDQDQEKAEVSKQLKGVTTDIAEVKGELGKVKEGMYCSKDGRYCFQTPEELQSFMASQKEKVDGIESKVTDIGAKIKEVLDKAKAPPSGVAGLEPLEKMTDEKRDAYTEEQNQERDRRFDALFENLNMSDNDAFRRILKNKANISGMVKNVELRKGIFANPTDEEGKKLMLMGCKGDKCRPWRQGLEKEEGVRIYVKDERGKWNWVDQPPKPDMGMV